MICINTKQLVSAITEADIFQIPNMNEGTTYLYNTVYDNLSQNKDMKLSEINFDAFTVEDIVSLGDLHTSFLEKNQCTANNIISTLDQVAPICKTVCYI